jgi:hypothetical protein
MQPTLPFRNVLDDKYTIGFSPSQTTGKAREMITDIEKMDFM